MMEDPFKELQIAMMDEQFGTVENYVDWFLRETGIKNDSIKRDVLDLIKAECGVEPTDKPSVYFEQCVGNPDTVGAIKLIIEENAFDLCVREKRDEYPMIHELCDVIMTESKLSLEEYKHNPERISKEIANWINDRYSIRRALIKIIEDIERSTYIPLSKENDICRIAADGDSIYIKCDKRKEPLCKENIWSYMADIGMESFLFSTGETIPELLNEDLEYKVENYVLEEAYETAREYLEYGINMDCGLKVGGTGVKTRITRLVSPDEVEKTIKDTNPQHEDDIRNLVERAKKQNIYIPTGYMEIIEIT